MHESADITAYKLVPEGTYLQIFIPGKNLMEPIIEKHMNSCSIWLDDGRHISSDQRRKIYATVNDISAYSGNVPEVEKEWLKCVFPTGMYSSCFNKFHLLPSQLQKYLQFFYCQFLRVGFTLSKRACAKPQIQGQLIIIKVISYFGFFYQ